MRKPLSGLLGAVELEPNSTRILLTGSVALYQRLNNDHAQAARVFARSLKLDPQGCGHLLQLWQYRATNSASSNRR